MKGLFIDFPRRSAYSRLSPTQLESPASCAALKKAGTVSDPRGVILVTDHEDTAELYRLALEHAGYSVQRCLTANDAVDACAVSAPLAIVVHFTPRHDAAATGAMLRSHNPGSVLIGLFSIQLQLSTLRDVLDHFDDVIMIPCVPETLVSRIVRLQERKRRQASA
jgi:DNA-binding response OmpR family regulator